MYYDMLTVENPLFSYSLPVDPAVSSCMW